MRRRALGWGLVPVLLLSCSRRSGLGDTGGAAPPAPASPPVAAPASPSPAPGPAAPGPPDLRAEFPMVPAHAPVAPPAGAMGPRAGGAPAALPPEAPRGAAGSVSGTIVLAPELEGKVAPTDVLYVIARPAAGGRPVGLKRIAPAAFPASFTLTAADNPMGTGSIEGLLLIRAKVDKDGDAMTNAAGDLEGVVRDVPAGTRDVRLVIDTVVESLE